MSAFFLKKKKKLNTETGPDIKEKRKKRKESLRLP